MLLFGSTPLQASNHHTKLDFAISTLNYSVSRLKKKGPTMPSLVPDVATVGRRLAGLASGEALSPRSCTSCGVNDGRVAFSQKRRCRSHQGRSTDRQRVVARCGVRRTGRAPGPASYGRRENFGAI